ncbi:MAG: glycoside hydrolase family 15 protein [Acidimicrobiia bacterium]
MASRIEQYALIGYTQTAAIVAADGAVDWLCVPRFDSGACFAALLGTDDNGTWRLAPSAATRDGRRATRRRYRDGGLVLETEWELPEGTVRVVDFMPIRDRSVDLVRIVQGVSGTVTMSTELVVRFDYGDIVPWVRRDHDSLHMIAGPDALRITSDVPLVGADLRHRADFTVAAGEHVSFVLTWYPSHHDSPPPRCEPRTALARTTAAWDAWSARSVHRRADHVPEPWCDLVQRSLVTLKALTFAPTGGIVAAPTTSLPEWPGGVRNWDYRYCWLRDATFTLYSLMNAGFDTEAVAFRDWLLRAVAGDPSRLQIMYGPAGERRLDERELPWLDGYERSRPVRVGNAASAQFQLDVYGEVIDSLHQMRRMGIDGDQDAWQVELALLDFLEGAWREPDEGIWEVRGGRRDFTHSMVMAWVAFDRAVHAVDDFGLDGPADKWRACRDEVHREVCAEGFDAERNAFTQSYGSPALDAATLMIPLVGFLPCDDPRVVGTGEAIGRELLVDGFVARYDSATGTDGLPPGEGVFLPCSFWYADALAMLGRTADATALFERLAGLCNDVGLISEEYDPAAKRLLGNFPQAFTHVSLVNTADNLALSSSPARHRAHESDTGAGAGGG